jgi:hypothetical protein
MIDKYQTHQQKWAIFEREPRMNAKPDEIIFGPFITHEDAASCCEAVAARERYFNESNYYVAKCDSYGRLQRK